GRALAALGSRPRPGDALDRHPAVAVSPGTGPLRLTHRGAPTLAWSASADRRAALAYPSAAVR
ncbi:MAG: hypothetical protein Q7T71_04415, partial [Herbiconiux sp.]|nr:hypothetical protein [Herbiconiux sp.]